MAGIATATLIVRRPNVRSRSPSPFPDCQCQSLRPAGVCLVLDQAVRPDRLVYLVIHAHQVRRMHGIAVAGALVLRRGAC
jgi:hypothetical protein